VLRLWIAILVLVIAALGLAWVGTRGQQIIVTESGLRYQVVQEGSGQTIQAVDLVQLHYTGKLEDGTVFDSSVSRGQPMETGISGIIPGLAEALQLMRKGGSYRIWIPPHLGYGSQVPQGAPFPPNATLQFDINILDVMPGMGAAAEMQRAQQMQQLQQQMQNGGAPHGPGGPEGALPPGMDGAGAPGAGPAGPPSGRQPGR
jgi:FKBP-type peptidyl-prolyl cis-trans isomerase FkpA